MVAQEVRDSLSMLCIVFKTPTVLLIPSLYSVAVFFQSSVKNNSFKGLMQKVISHGEATLQTAPSWKKHFSQLAGSEARCESIHNTSLRFIANH